MNFYQIGGFSFISLVHGLVIPENQLINLKPRFLIKGGYYIIPSPSTSLIGLEVHSKSSICFKWLLFSFMIFFEFLNLHRFAVNLQECIDLKKIMHNKFKSAYLA
jgi:hypothetical protein